MLSRLVLTILIVIASARAVAGPAAAQASSIDPLLVEAAQAFAQGSVAQFVESMETRLRPLVADPNNADLAQLTRLAALREMGKYFSRIEDPEESSKQTLAWLIQQPQLLETLMMSISDSDAPDRVLEVLAALHSAHAQKLVEFPELTAALCVVWDTPQRTNPDEPTADAERAVWLFRYFTNARQSLRFNPKTLAWELSIYVVDLPLSQDEIIWATNRYAKRGAVGAVYFDVPYDFNAFYGMAEKRIGAREYTLQNLVQYGGVCGDQAYFATQVSRSLGVPACIASGLGGSSEVGHAWVGYLDARGQTISWNFSEGRYPEHRYWKGAVQDPQTRRLVTDSDVSVLAELSRTGPRQRLASQALVKSADLAPSGQAMEVYTHAINLSPGNRRAWIELAAMGADMKLTDRQLTTAMDVVNRFAAKSYADFAFDILLKLNSGRGTEQQLQALRQARTLFRDRPDLQASIRLAEGDLMRNNQRPRQALAAYGDVLRQYSNAGPIVLEAIARTDDLLRQHNELVRLAAIYREVLQRFPQPRPTGYARSTPYYRIAHRYLDLLEEIGDAREASRVRARLGSLTVQPAGR